jgi:hypothetical protein
VGVKFGFIMRPGIDDDKLLCRATPNIPYFTMGYDGNIHGSIGNKNGTHPINLPKGYQTIKDLINGADFRGLIKNNIRR